MNIQERLRQARDNPAPYEDRYLALVDVLGWSEIVRRSVPEQAVMSSINEAAELISLAPRPWAKGSTDEIDLGSDEPTG